MKILQLSDLHLNNAWFEWASQHAREYDLICVSGDLLDMFARAGRFWGVLAVKDWVDAFPGNLALCSGNHDCNDPENIFSTRQLPLLDEKDRREAEKLMLLERWMDALARPGVVTDNRTELLQTQSGRLVVTTIPYNFNPWHPHKDLWKAGAKLRKETGAPWFVLHHDPPAGPGVGGHYGNSYLPSHIKRYKPDFLLCGHIHQQPYHGDFAERLASTWCFNPGWPEEDEVATEIPNHIVLDLREGAATWHFTKPGATGQQTRRIALRSQ